MAAVLILGAINPAYSFGFASERLLGDRQLRGSHVYRGYSRQLAHCSDADDRSDFKMNDTGAFWSLSQSKI
jgi:hypothetical protein